MESWQAAAVDYLAEGAAAGDRLLYVADKPETGLVADLAGLADRDGMLDSRQLRLASTADVYGPTAQFHVATQVAAFAGQASAATGSGYRGFRLASEATSLVSGAARILDSAAYELAVDEMIATNGMSAMCGYDRRTAAEALPALALVHPLRHAADETDAPGLYFDPDQGRWHLAGEIDLAVDCVLRSALAWLVRVTPGQADLHLDLRAVEFIDVRGVHALIAVADELAPSRHLVLHDVPAVLRRILDLAWTGSASGVEIAD